MKKFTGFSIAVIIIMLAIVPAFAQTGIRVGDTAFVSQAQARLRGRPSMDSVLIDTLYNGAKVTIIETTNSYHGWYKVDTGVSRGYIREDYLSRLTQDDPGYNVSYYGAVNQSFRKGDAVVGYLSYIREDLQKCGYSLNASTFDDGWVTAVKDFQSKHALTADGVIGKQTKKALWRATH